MTGRRFVSVCRVDDIAPGQTGDFQAGGHSILVANCDGTFYAIEDRCTHDDGPLAEGRLRRCQVECPRHGARFDMKTGRATALPAFLPVASFPCRVTDDGMVEVDIEARSEGLSCDDQEIGFSL